MNRLWHNPKCSKSRAARLLLQENGVEFQARLYLQQPPTSNELNALMGKMGLQGDDILQLVRTSEPQFKTTFGDDPPDVFGLVYAVMLHPILLQRPVFETASRAIIGRPPELVLSLLK